MFVGPRPNWPECPFVRDIYFKNGHSGREKESTPKPKEEWIFVNRKVNAKKYRAEWCAAANTYRSMRCGRSSNNMKNKENVRDQGGCEKTPTPGKMEQSTFGRARHGEKSWPQWRGFFFWFTRCSGCAAVYTETKMDESVQAGEIGYERIRKEYGKMCTRISKLEEERVFAKNAKGREIEGQKDGSPGRNA